MRFVKVRFFSDSLQSKSLTDLFVILSEEYNDESRNNKAMTITTREFVKTRLHELAGEILRIVCIPRLSSQGGSLGMTNARLCAICHTPARLNAFFTENVFRMFFHLRLFNAS
jgi:hypothetical protein